MKGENPVVIFIHGFSEDKSCWDKLIENLGHLADCISYDCTGHGTNMSLPDDFGFNSYVNQLNGLIDGIPDLDKKKIYLVGHSQGAAIAASTVKTNRHKISGLLLISPFLTVEHPLKTLWGEFDRLVRAGHPEIFWRINSALLLGPLSTGWQSFREDAIHSRLSRFSNEHLVKLINALLEIRLDDLAFLNDLPVYLIHGEYDTMFPSYYSKMLARQLKNPHLTIVENANHLLSEMENPIIQHIKKMLGQLPA